MLGSISEIEQGDVFYSYIESLDFSLSFAFIFDFCEWGAIPTR